MDIAVLLPTLHRPEGLRLALQSIRDTAPSVNIVVARDADDIHAKDIADEFGAMCVTCAESRMGCAYAWNTALRACPNADMYVLGSDDAVFLSGWLKEGLEYLNKIDGSGLVGLKTKEYGKYELSAFYLMTRDFIINHHGGVAAVPHYASWFVDAEACGRAQKAGCYAKTTRRVVVHNWRGPNGDEAYRLANKRRQENRKIYEDRKSRGFPDDFKPIISGESNG